MKAGGEPQKGRTRELDGYRIGDLGQAVAGVEGIGGGGAGNSGMQLNAAMQDLVPSIRFARLDPDVGRCDPDVATLPTLRLDLDVGTDVVAPMLRSNNNRTRGFIAYEAECRTTEFVGPENDSVCGSTL